MFSVRGNSWTQRYPQEWRPCNHSFIGDGAFCALGLWGMHFDLWLCDVNTEHLLCASFVPNLIFCVIRLHKLQVPIAHNDATKSWLCELDLWLFIGYGATCVPHLYQAWSSYGLLFWIYGTFPVWLLRGDVAWVLSCRLKLASPHTRHTRNIATKVERWIFCVI